MEHSKAHYGRGGCAFGLIAALALCLAWGVFDLAASLRRARRMATDGSGVPGRTRIQAAAR